MLKGYKQLLMILIVPLLLIGGRITINAQEAGGNLSVNLQEDNTSGIRDAEFTVYNQSNQEVTKFYTDENGEGLSQTLPLGTYTIYETKAATGYYENKSIYNAEISTDGEKVDINGGSPIINKKYPVEKIGQLSGHVTNENGSGIRDTEFNVYDQQNRLITSAKTDENGDFLTEKIPAGNYVIRQVVVAPGYIENKQFYYGKISENDQVTNINNGSDIINYKYETNTSGAIKLSVTDENGTPVSGAEFTIYDETNGNVGTIVTDELGYGVSKDLELGNYSIRETNTPYGYVENKTIYTVELKENGVSVDANYDMPIINYVEVLTEQNGETTENPASDDNQTTADDNQTTVDDNQATTDETTNEKPVTGKEEEPVKDDVNNEKQENNDKPEGFFTKFVNSFMEFIDNVKNYFNELF